MKREFLQNFKVGDGTYIYSNMYSYSAKDYAADRLANSTNEKIKSLCVVMLNYGAAAQVNFGYKPYDLMNADLTAEQQALVESYRSDMVVGLSGVDSAKIGVFASNNGFTDCYPAASFEGAFAINYYFTPTKAVDGEVTLYYWNQTDVNAADVLTVENATGVFPYSLGAYCVDRINNGTATTKELAAATAVYGYYAKNYFG